MAAEVRDLRWPSALDGAQERTLIVSARTHPGAVRHVNEDSFLVSPPVFVVADGMGGYGQGDVASARVIEAFERLVDVGDVSTTDIEDCITASRTHIRELATPDSAPGSTVVVAAFVLRDDVAYWLIAHEGDSRAYLWLRGELEQLTRDHSVVQEMVDAGEIHESDARNHPARHVVTRALGGKADTDPEFALIPASPGARLVMCSDGLSTELSDRSIGLILEQNPRSSDAVDALIEAAVKAGGRDNITAIVVNLVAEEAPELSDTLDSLGRLRDDTLKRVDEAS